MQILIWTSTLLSQNDRLWRPQMTAKWASSAMVSPMAASLTTVIPMEVVPGVSEQWVAAQGSVNVISIIRERACPRR